MIGVGVVLVLVAVASAVWLVGRDTPAPSPTPVAAAELPQQVAQLPPGATACPQNFPDLPYGHGAKGTPMTSCPFVEQVRLAYGTHAPVKGPVQLRVASPRTGRSYDVACTPTGAYVTCMGGVLGLIYLYNV